MYFGSACGLNMWGDPGLAELKDCESCERGFVCMHGLKLAGAPLAKFICVSFHILFCTDTEF